jgi:DNA-binding NarL/FixJ family response regulator
VLLQPEHRYTIVAEAAAIDALIARGADAAPIDVVVVDLSTREALEALVDSTHDLPGSGVVLLGPMADDPRPFSRFGDRPWAYLPRDAEGSEVTAAVSAVHAGLTAIHPDIATRLFSRQPVQRHAEPGEDAEDLTPRELEVLALLAEGIPNKVIARRLGISDHTVKFHVGSVLSKLDAASRTEAVSIGARRGLIAL